MDFDRFKLLHGPQLARVPQIYWRALYEKLCMEVYDAGKNFTMTPSGTGWKVVVSSEDGLKKDDPSVIFLIDHAWTFQPSSARQQLLHIPGLANRMAAMMGLTSVSMEMLLSGRDEEGEGSYEPDSESGDEKREWSDDDTDKEQEKESDIVTSRSPCGGGPETTLASALARDGYSSGDMGDVSQFYATEVPEEKESDSDNEATPKKTFKERYTLESNVDDKSSNPLGQAVMQDRPVDPAMDADATGKDDSDSKIVNEGLPPQDLPTEELVDQVMASMWPHCHAYHISNSPVPVWYMMDEFGSRIQQSCDPTVAMVAFFYIPTQLAFSVIWPSKDLDYAEEVTCNFLPECIKSDLDRACHTLPWSHDNQLTLESPLWKELGNFKIPEPQERSNEELPDPTHYTQRLEAKTHYTIYTDMKLVQTFLTHSAFKLTGSRKTADILWLSEHFKEFRSLSLEKYVNQFACENVLTCKDLLAVTSRRAKRAGTSSSREVGGPTSAPSWLPLTFNLLYELPLFVREYLERKERRKENTWIVKPWNLGRGLDIHVTDNLNQIIRLAQAGPKIVSKYISNPVLFQRDDLIGGRVKFDIRYVLLLTSVNPTVLHVYNVFWLRFANKPFSLEHLTDYDKHFTVMNYREESKLKQLNYDQFIPLFEQQYPGHDWNTVQEKIFNVFRELFVAATSVSPPSGLAPCNQSRSMYAADLMLEWVNGDSDTEKRMEPRLLEVNFTPDCVRACKYHPNFFNHVFEVLFLDDYSRSKDLPVTQLL